jgi:hypothetical protein
VSLSPSPSSLKISTPSTKLPWKKPIFGEGGEWAMAANLVDHSRLPSPHTGLVLPMSELMCGSNKSPLSLEIEEAGGSILKYSPELAIPPPLRSHRLRTYFELAESNIQIIHEDCHVTSHQLYCNRCQG